MVTILWKWLAAIGGFLILVLTALGLWQRREAEQSGARAEKQRAEQEKAKRLAADLEALRQRQVERLAAEDKREREEAEARARADAATQTPPEAPQSAEEILEQVRRQRRDVE